jgi:NADPH-dependent curcumin reductase CurA
MPRQIILASRPSGWPTADNFALTAFIDLLRGANTGKMLVRL